MSRSDQNGNKIIDPNTKEQATIDPKDSAAVFVDLAKSNSKFYYILGAVHVPGRLPITGNETILDAISFAGGLIRTRAATRWCFIVRSLRMGN